MPATALAAVDYRELVPLHEDGTPDTRYEIELEYCGYPEARPVARWCGEWIGSADTKVRAALLCVDHSNARRVKDAWAAAGELVPAPASPPTAADHRALMHALRRVFPDSSCTWRSALRATAEQLEKEARHG